MQVGYDLGYGYAKLCYGPDFKTNWFPSVLATAEEFEQEGKGFGDYSLEIDGRKSYIGYAALNSKSKLLLSAFEGDRMNNQVFKDLFLGGLASCVSYGTELSVVTGLPINAYRLYKADVEHFRGRYDVTLNHKRKTLVIENIKVIPQPLGTYFKLLPAYPGLKNLSLLIVDIGFKTTDLLRIEKDVPLASSTSLNFGMSDVARQLVSWVNSQIDGRTWTINEIDELIDFGFVKNGVRHMIPDEMLDNSLRKTFQAIWSRIVEYFPEYGTLDRIIFTGGTSVRFKRFISELPIDSMAISSEAQMSNAIGYREALEWAVSA